jgi:hypothetical protein
MKKKLLLLALLTSTITTWAQITIGSSDLPTINDVYIRDNAGNTSIIDLAVTGANVTWDYSALTSTGMDTIDYMAVSSTNLAYQFYFNNSILYANHKSDLAINGIDFPAIPAVPITITNVVNYFKIANNDGYYQTGFGASISGLPASIRYIPRDKLLPLPCNFGTNESNPFEWNFDVPSIGSYGQNKTRTVEVDGWGTLNLPNGGTYNTLRVKSTIEGIDTVYIAQFNFGIAIPSTQLEYKWYAQGEGEPVLTVNATSLLGAETISSVNHKHHDSTAGLQKQSLLRTQLDLFPNPSQGIASIKYYTPVQGPLTIQVIDITGKKILLQQETSNANTNNQFQLNLDQLASGLYTLQILQEGSVSSAKMMIK